MKDRFTSTGMKVFKNGQHKLEFAPTATRLIHKIWVKGPLPYSTLRRVRAYHSINIAFVPASDVNIFSMTIINQ
jgi:hypothetical protein